MTQQKSTEIMQSKCDAFNEKNPVGSPVTVVKGLDERIDAKVRYPARILNGHTAVVWLKEINGCYRLDKVVA